VESDSFGARAGAYKGGRQSEKAVNNGVSGKNFHKSGLSLKRIKARKERVSKRTIKLFQEILAEKGWTCSRRRKESGRRPFEIRE